MILITTHLNADFDCLASMMAALKLYPEAALVFPGSQEKNVRNFLEKTGYPLPVKKLKNIDFAKVKKLVVVDTTSRERLGRIGELCDKPGIIIDIFDHHPSESNDIPSQNRRIAPRGANSSLMVEVLQERGIEINPEEATLLMLGIYEDTGSLTFTSTCKEDFRAAEFLLERGAKLNTVSDFLHRNLNAEQVALLHDLLNRLEIHTINGVEVATAVAKVERYVGDIAVVVHSLKEMENLAAVFVVVEMDGRINLIARSRVGAIDAGQVAERFGGGGHPTAAAATIKNMVMGNVRKALIKILEEVIPPAPTAGELMVTHVISVKKSDPVSMVEKILTRHSFNALPVVENGKAIGLITRQIIEKVLYHKMKGATAGDYMQRDIYQVKTEESYETVKRIIIHQKQKLVPVVDDNGIMIGAIGRLDVINAIYSDFMKSPSGMLHPQRKMMRPIARDLSGIIRERLPVKVRELFDLVAKCADEMGFNAYAVGGFVRDLLLRRDNLDVDIVIEGDGIEFAERFIAKHGGRVKSHKKFKTAIMVVPGFGKVDIATARTEYYEEPAALPIVELSSIKNDLYRRDFTINALAVKLNGKDKNRLIDFFGGQQDLKDGVIRVLHNLSFVEDPTRIFRAIRFEERFHFSLGTQTENLLKLAIRKDLVERISGSRLFTELHHIFNEEHMERAVKRITDFDLWRFLHPAIRFNEKTVLHLDAAREAVHWHKLTFDAEKVSPWLVYLYSISNGLGRLQTGELFQRLGFEKTPIKRFLTERRKAKNALAFLEETKPKSPVIIYDTLNGLEPESLLAVMAALGKIEGKRIVADYMTRLRYVKPKVTGKDLIKAGIKENPSMGLIIEALKMETLKEALPTVSDEITFAKKLYKVLKKNRNG